MEKSPLKKLPLIAGAVLLTIMTGLLGIFVFSNEQRSEAVLVNHFIILLYAVLLLLARIFKKNSQPRATLSILLVMLVIDAYSLNFQFDVFSPMAVWFGVSIVLLCLNILAVSFIERFPEWLKCLLAFTSGVSFLVPLMPALTMGFVYLAGVVGLIVIGMGIVAFAPLLLLLHNSLIAYRLFLPVKRYRYFFFSGLSIVTIYAMVYCITYATSLNHFERLYKQSTAPGSDEQPAWINVAQQLELTPMMNRILRTRITLDAFGDFADMGNRSFDDNAHYDPLFVLATGLFSTTIVEETDRLNILGVLADKRHYAEERLWDGDYLRTASVNTRAQVWPSNHIAYTEHTIVVENTNPHRWTTSEEAIYTFHLPEGATVTALSLWIGDREEKGILTTRDKAMAAYRDVVGVQRRDPSIVQWREGDRVSVRVFPVTQDAPRKFKIGITAPLQAGDRQLTYQPGWFEGPAGNSASYDVKLQFEDKPINIVYPDGFYLAKDNTVGNIGRYSDDWKVTFADPGLTNSAFRFDNTRYTLQPYKPAISVLDPDTLYLDINRHWPYKDYLQLVTTLRSKKLYVYKDQKWISVNPSNARQVFEERQQLRFSLFPFHRVPAGNNTLVITAGGKSGPFLSDLSFDSFSASLNQYLQSHHPVVFNIGDTVSPFIGSLSAAKQITLQKGELSSLVTQLQRRTFSLPVKAQDRIDIPAAGISIVQAPDSGATRGPDHLARLFAYHWLLEASARQPADTNKLMDVAAKGYVVSPVSSLLVLETQADYDKHKIANNEIGLQNAALKGHGSVPEPHEWALFILAVSILAYVRYGKLFFGRKKTAC